MKDTFIKIQNSKNIVLIGAIEWWVEWVEFVYIYCVIKIDSFFLFIVLFYLSNIRYPISDHNKINDFCAINKICWF